MSVFKDLRIVDNFYQTSAFFPMPTILISTLTKEGETSLGSYSLCFPYYVAGKSYYAMLLECRNSSNTAQNLLRTGKCALNFMEDNKKQFKEIVRLGFPGADSKDKMADCSFHLEKGLANDDDDARPLVVQEAYQVFECTWQDDLENAFEDKERIGQLEGIDPPYRDFNGITSEHGAHFILKIDKILMKEPFYSGIIDGVKARSFPKVVVDYGYRDNVNFWYTRFSKPFSEKVPAAKENDISFVMYSANQMDPDVKFTEEACMTIIKVPRIFLKTVLKSCVEWAKENGVTLIDEEHMKQINDKRNKEKNH